MTDMKPPNLHGTAARVPISEEEFRRLSHAVHVESGILLNDRKKELIVSRLSRRLRVLGIETFSAYCDAIERSGGEAERREMVQCLTTNVTRFFREPHHFVTLRDHVLPDLAHHIRQGGRARFWCAACSSGEEAYSLAMCILQIVPDAPDRDVRILATDIDRHVLKTAGTGLYDHGVPNDVPREFQQCFGRHTEKTADGIAMNPEVRRLIRFAELNLIRGWPMKGLFDVVFCRNVAIYFDAETQQTLWQRLAGTMSTGGHLFIGHSERVSGPAAQRFATRAGTHYQLLSQNQGNP